MPDLLHVRNLTLIHSMYLSKYAQIINPTANECVKWWICPLWVLHHNLMVDIEGLRQFLRRSQMVVLKESSAKILLEKHQVFFWTVDFVVSYEDNNHFQGLLHVMNYLHFHFIIRLYSQYFFVFHLICQIQNYFHSVSIILNLLIMLKFNFVSYLVNQYIYTFY